MGSREPGAGAWSLAPYRKKMPMFTSRPGTVCSPRRPSRGRAFRSTLISIVLACLFSCLPRDCPAEPGPEAVPTPGTPAVLEGPVHPDTYLLGPGDEIAVALWKEIDRREIVRITPEGLGLVHPVGPIPLGGRTLSEAIEQIRSTLGSYYRKEDISVSLVSLRHFIVHVVGDVHEPGPIEIQALRRASHAIELAGGLTETASRRNIQLRHSDGSERRVDLVAYQRTGDLTMNPPLRDGDVLEIPSASNWTSVFGAVAHPGSYEFVDNETLGELVKLLGGTLPDVDRRSVELQRFGERNPAFSQSIRLEFERALDPSPDNGFPLKEGDRVFFRLLHEWHRDARVELRGEFLRPGVYVISEDSERVLDVVARAGGVTARAAPREAKLLRNAFETSGQGVDREVAFLVGKKTEQIAREDYEFLKSYYREDRNRLAIDLDALFLHSDSTQNLLLADGDVLIMPTRANVVRVSGLVVSPGLVPFDPAEGYGYYIENAGGYDRSADRGKVRVIKKRSGARLKPTGHVRIEPGDMIWVPPREERDWWQITREFLSTAAQVATIYLVIDSTQP